MPQTGKHSGKRLQGSVYRSIVRLAANGDTVNQIARKANVAWKTANAVIQYESKSILERKQILADQFARIAMRGAERLEDEIDKATFSQLIPAVGMSLDKVVALTSQPADQNQAHLHLHLQPIDLIGQFNNLLGKLKDEQRPVIDVDPEPASTSPANVLRVSSDDMRRVSSTIDTTKQNKSDVEPTQDKR